MICTQIKGQMAQLWKSDWQDGTRWLLKTALSEFHRTEQADFDALITAIFIFTFTINSACEVFHPAVIILNVGCLDYFQGATENTYKDFTEQVTVSSIQLMDYHHGYHYLLKIQAQQCPRRQLQPCWHNTGNRSWRLDPKSTFKKKEVTSTAKLCYQYKMKGKLSPIYWSYHL